MPVARSRSAIVLSLPLLVALAVALAVGAGVTSPVHGQDGADGVDALMGSLLQPEDMPTGFSTLGPEEGSQFDIDSGAFSQAGGRRVVSQAWSSETSGVVFDFRMELPSPEAAARYLDEAEGTLSEADVTGLTLESDDPPIGEDARHYAGVTRVGEAAITFDNYLFHVGPVAAKVFVASVEMPDGEARRLAEVAAQRMAGFATTGLGPGAPDAEAPVSPLETPSAAAGPAGRLSALVPEAVAASCRPFESGTVGEVGALSCSAGDDRVVYSELSDASALAGAFETVTAEMPTDALAGSCAEGPFSGPYADATASGLVACWDPPGDGLVLFWTDDATLVLGGVLADTDEFEGLVAAWRAAQLR